MRTTYNYLRTSRKVKMTTDKTAKEQISEKFESLVVDAIDKENLDNFTELMCLRVKLNVFSQAIVLQAIETGSTNPNFFIRLLSYGLNIFEPLRDINFNEAFADADDSAFERICMHGEPTLLNILYKHRFIDTTAHHSYIEAVLKKLKQRKRHTRRYADMRKYFTRKGYCQYSTAPSYMQNQAQGRLNILPVYYPVYDVRQWNEPVENESEDDSDYEPEEENEEIRQAEEKRMI